MLSVCTLVVIVYPFSMNGLPRWDLSAIYPSPESKEFSSDIDHLAEIGSRLISLSSSGGASLRELIDLKDRGDSILINLSAYTEALLSTASDDPVYMKAASMSEDAAVRYQKAEDAFLRAVPSLLPEAEEDEGLASYRYYIGRLGVECSHLMSPEEEALAAELSRSGSTAWEHLMAGVTSSASDGERTLTELRAAASSPERSIRKDAYEREIALLETHSTALAAALCGVKGTVITLDRRRGWSDPLERSLFASAIGKETLESLISAIEESLPSFRSYFRTKARLLGLDALDFFDLLAPVGDGGNGYSYADAVDIVVSSYSSFSPEMGSFARHAVESGWIDAEPRKGKSGGAYDTFFPESGESRVFCNFDGSYDSVSTRAHELGHAYHDSVIKDLPPSLSTYPMTLAETASTFSEMLVFDSVLSSSSGGAALSAVESFVQSAAQVIVDIYSRFLFERAVFERRKSGDISADELSSMMLDAQEKAYGDALGVKHRYMWAVKSHYYSADFSYYNYPYAFGELFALALFSRRGEKGFDGVYRSVLRNTGMMDAASCAALAGADINAPSFWNDGISVILSYAERLASWS